MRQDADGADEALFEESLEDLYEHAPCGYASTLPDGLIVKANRTLLDWIGQERDAVVGKRHFHELLTVGGQIYFETHLAPLLVMQGFVNEIALELRRAHGPTLPVLATAVQKRNAAGKHVVTRTTLFDATERRRYEQELLRERQRAEEALAQVKTLRGLLPICAWCHRVRDDAGYWERVDHYLEKHSEVEVTHGICGECENKA